MLRPRRKTQGSQADRDAKIMMASGAQIPRRRPETQVMFGLFKIGVGPSLSYTVGPMKAASASDNGLIVAPGRARVVVATPGPCKQTEATDGRCQCIKLYLINIS